LIRLIEDPGGAERDEESLAAVLASRKQRWPERALWKEPTMRRSMLMRQQQ